MYRTYILTNSKGHTDIFLPEHIGNDDHLNGLIQSLYFENQFGFQIVILLKPDLLYIIKATNYTYSLHSSMMEYN